MKEIFARGVGVKLLIAAVLGLSATSIATGQPVTSEQTNQARDWFRKVMSHPDVGILCAKDAPHYPWLSGLEDRTYESWAPGQPGLASAIHFVFNENGKHKRFEFVQNSGSAQYDADCLQSVLGAEAYIPFNGKNTELTFKFNDHTNNFFKKNHVEPTLFRPAPRALPTLSVYRIPLDVLNRYSGTFLPDELLDVSNRIDIKNPGGKTLLSDTAQKQIVHHYDLWSKFYANHAKASKEELLEQSAIISKL